MKNDVLIDLTIVLISYRIISTQRRAQSAPSSMCTSPKRIIDMKNPLSRVVVIVIESGRLFPLVFFTFYALILSSAFMYLTCLTILIVFQVKFPVGALLIVHFVRLATTFPCRIIQTNPL